MEIISMSNFEDYDLRRSSTGSSNRSGARLTGSRSAASRQAGSANRTSYNRDVYGRQQDDLSPNLSLDDELDLYDYDFETGRAIPKRPSSGTSASASHRSASAHSGERRRPSGSRSSANRPTGSRSGAGQKKRPAEDPRKDTRKKNAASASEKNSISLGAKSSGVAKRPQSKKAKKKKMRRNLIIGEVAVLLILLIVFFVWNKLGKVNWDNISMDDVDVNNLDSATEEVLSQYTTLALFGVDNRSNGNLDSGNSDTIIIVSINNESKEVKMLSVQRDTYLKVDDDTYRKCNYAYNHGGVEKAISMLNTNLDLKIDGYVSVDFYALATIVDDLGGLELEITQKMIDTNNPETGQNALAGYIAEVENVLNYYPDEEDGWKYSDCYFDSPGTYTLNGAQVVGFCRNRYAVDNDYGRAENQRLVIKKIVEKAKSAKLTTLNKIADDVLPEVATSLSSTQVLSMAASVSDYEIVDSSGFPFALKSTKISQKTGSVLVPCTLASNVSALHEFLYEQTDYDPTDDTVDVISDYIVNQTGFTEDSADINQTSDSSDE